MANDLREALLESQLAHNSQAKDFFEQPDIA